jgi:alpha-beta hydrolase superfamily lysophospholipase
MAETSTLSTYTASDGENIAVQDWPMAEGGRLRGVVLIVHGLGEHAGRYDHVATRLNSWGFAVRGYDHYGHGDSGGPRGTLSNDARLLEDLDDVLESTRARMDNRTPLILLGHSMGGLVAARYVSLRRRPVDALVLSSPALDPALSAVQKLLVGILPKLAPNLRVSNGLDANYLSHDPEVVRAYLADPLVHDRISGRLARFIAVQGAATIACAPRWSTPTLLMYAGADRMVNPAGSRAFAAAAPKQVVTSHCFESHYHELFNEVDREPVFAMLRQWLDARFPRR